MELKKQEILAALLQKGLIHLNRQIRLALVPQRIAVISSETAAGLQDYLEHIAINPYGYQFENHLFAAAMQGNNVEKEVGNQLKKIARLKENYDAVIIIRGGGAKLDLAAFDNFELGQLVAQFPLPVLVGIGHEVDETVLDKVAHTSLKTPTAVADFLINRLMQFETTILKYQSTILNTASYIIQNEKGLLTYQKKMLEIQAKNKLKEANFTIEQLQNRLPILATNNVATEKRSLAQLEKIYHLLTPETALKRGFSIVTKNGKVVVDAAQVKPGDIIETQLAKGNIKSIIQ
jgi:exodeoxyribonuclease VII large subunit